MRNVSNIIIEYTPARLVYSFYISDNITSLDDHISYKLHLTCLDEMLKSRYMFSEIIFVITANDLNNKLIKELMFRLSVITIMHNNVRFITDFNDPTGKDGTVFKNYVLDKLGEYDGLTLFFHNKGLDRKYDNDFPYAWIIGQYYFNYISSQFHGDEFVKRPDTLLYGWPFIHDTHHSQWLFAGSCYWMKCQKLAKYLNDHQIENEDKINSRTLAEYYFLTRIPLSHVDYVLSDVIKENITLRHSEEYYNFTTNTGWIHYLQDTLPYSIYMRFIEFYNKIINMINK